MAQINPRIPIPRKPDELLELARLIEAQHTAEGANSPLQLLDMAAFATKLAEADGFNTEAKNLRRQSEEATESRNLVLGMGEGQLSDTPGTVRYYVIATRDTLQGLFRGQERKLGDWGFTIDSTPGTGDVRAPIPTNIDKLAELAADILKKHALDDPNSPLGIVLDMADFIAKFAIAENLVNQAKKLRRDSEAATQNRNLSLGLSRNQKSKSFGTVLFFVSSARDILKGKYRANQQMLGNWGFTVDSSPTGGSGGDGSGEDDGGDDV